MFDTTYLLYKMRHNLSRGFILFVRFSHPSFLRDSRTICRICYIRWFFCRLSTPTWIGKIRKSNCKMSTPAWHLRFVGSWKTSMRKSLALLTRGGVDGEIQTAGRVERRTEYGPAREWDCWRGERAGEWRRGDGERNRLINWRDEAEMPIRKGGRSEDRPRIIENDSDRFS